nr:hypothetical protein GCM10020185_34710 [Pseudomonas brassicacearum subsp. brassicacearum]
MVITDLLLLAQAVDPRQGFVAVVGVDVEAGLAVAVFLQKLQRIPGETGAVEQRGVAVVLGFFSMRRPNGS